MTSRNQARQNKYAILSAAVFTVVADLRQQALTTASNAFQYALDEAKLNQSNPIAQQRIAPETLTRIQNHPTDDKMRGAAFAKLTTELLLRYPGDHAAQEAVAINLTKRVAAKKIALGSIVRVIEVMQYSSPATHKLIALVLMHIENKTLPASLDELKKFKFIATRLGFTGLGSSSGSVKKKTQQSVAVEPKRIFRNEARNTDAAHRRNNIATKPSSLIPTFRDLKTRVAEYPKFEASKRIKCEASTALFVCLNRAVEDSLRPGSDFTFERLTKLLANASYLIPHKNTKELALGWLKYQENAISETSSTTLNSLRIFCSRAEVFEPRITSAMARRLDVLIQRDGEHQKMWSTACWLIRYATMAGEAAPFSKSIKYATSEMSNHSSNFPEVMSLADSLAMLHVTKQTVGNIKAREALFDLWNTALGCAKGIAGDKERTRNILRLADLANLFSFAPPRGLSPQEWVRHESSLKIDDFSLAVAKHLQKQKIIRLGDNRQCRLEVAPTGVHSLHSDIYLPKHGCVIECDGASHVWHSSSASKPHAYNSLVDAILINAGHKVIRVSTNEQKVFVKSDYEGPVELALRAYVPTCNGRR